MQVVQVMKGDPTWMKSLLTTLASTNEIKIIEKTKSNGEFIVVSDDSASTGQLIEVIMGAPEDLASAMTALGDIEILANTFSAAHYLAVYT